MSLEVLHSDSQFVIHFTVSGTVATIGAFRQVEDTWGIVYSGKNVYGTINSSTYATAPATTVAIGKVATITYRCANIKVPKAVASGEDIAIGNYLYLSATDKNVSKTKGGTHTLFVGICVKAATSTDTTVQADLDTRFAALTAA